MTHLNEALVLVGGAVLSFGLVSRFVRKHALSEVLAALLLGVLIGPSALNVLNLHRWGIQSLIVEEVARLTLAVGLMSSALRLSRTVLSRHWRSLSLLLTLVMIMTWVIPLDRLLLLPVFMVLGTVLPWHAWDRLG
ncbi:MAG TPA: cation:proton antiporter [Thermomicrobiaceae bacterium]|nr:cation:proton antiporter [Thermomicrobiaceae bacterium]